mgnify:FL=1
MVFTVTPVEGVTVKGVYNGETEITGATNIAIVGNKITIKAAYLATQEVGDLTLTIDFSDFTDLSAVIKIVDTTEGV